MAEGQKHPKPQTRQESCLHNQLASISLQMLRQSRHRSRGALHGLHETGKLNLEMQELNLDAVASSSCELHSSLNLRAGPTKARGKK